MSMTELEKRCVDALAKAQGLDPHEISALPISTATGNLLDEVRAVLAEAGVAELVEALRRSREGWENAVDLGIIPKQHRITAMILADVARAALAKIGANQ